MGSVSLHLKESNYAYREAVVAAYPRGDGYSPEDFGEFPTSDTGHGHRSRTLQRMPEFPQLLPDTYVQFPPDGIYDYDFVAAPPEDVAAQVLTRITATLQGLPQGAQGIRVHASLNSKEALISPHDSASTAGEHCHGRGHASRHL